VYLERIIVTNFRCFGPQPQNITFDRNVTAFVGANGAGKTALMQALLRLFGVTNDQRRIRRQDFHIPAREAIPPAQRNLSLEAILAFPELQTDDGQAAFSVPEFFQQMAADVNGTLKCRLRLEATWADDGSLEGAIDQKLFAVRTLADRFEESDCSEVRPTDRGRVQMIYVPAVRDGASQLTAFLRGRLWRAITWSQQIRTVLTDAGQTLNDTFRREPGVDLIAAALEKRWQEVQSAGTDTTPAFRPVDLRIQEFIRKIEVVFRPDEAGRERSLDELSDGQRSLFHLAMTAATLDVEGKIVAGTAGAAFQAGAVVLPALTLIAVEEPENNLAPFYLSRIIQQVVSLTGERAQAMVSSHSASILVRIDPEQVRHFRLDPGSRSALVRTIRMPPESEQASVFVREAVRTYPELYFARFVILGEGASEEVVLPPLADALEIPIDRSFVAIVPLGGRHVNHLWRLLSDLEIPHATLLDLDAGRAGGGWARIKSTCRELIANGTSPATLFSAASLVTGVDGALNSFDGRALDHAQLKTWTDHLRRFGIFFCSPLDLDWSMLSAFPDAYHRLEEGMTGPSERGDAKLSVLGPEGVPAAHAAALDDQFRWYRYLFIGRGKPSTHVRALSYLSAESLRSQAPEELAALLRYVADELFGIPGDEEDPW
jgi:putative ATP-dependent endonuclease of the OLD family